MNTDKLLEKINEATLANADLGFRTHLGGSLIAHSCARHVWYNFRWAATETPEPRMVRLWARGDREEEVFEDLLRLAGMEIHTLDASTGTQFRISDFGGHYGGSLDGIGLGFPTLPGIWLLLEFKTHNNKSFTKLKKEGVEKSKPQHYGQMQTYMGYKGLTHALYCAVNKDNDELHFEIVLFNEPIFNRYKMRAANTIGDQNPPAKISQSSAWFECRFCEFADVCHRDALPYRNCRTCKFAEPNIDTGKWDCTKHKKQLSKQEQLDACKDYAPNKKFNK